MRSDAPLAALRDIAHHIDLAVQFTAGFDYEAFVADPRTVYAVTRCLEIISEASRRRLWIPACAGTTRRIGSIVIRAASLSVCPDFCPSYRYST
jgi:hypothetical protein